MTPVLLALLGLFAPKATTPILPANEVMATLVQGPKGVPVLELHELACVFQEGEPDALPYTAQTGEDCGRVNRASGELRKKNFKRLRLRAGKYIVRALNVNSPFTVAFELRGERDVALPKVEAKDIAPGTGKEMPITFEPGLYIYRDPVAQTAAYEILVER